MLQESRQARASNACGAGRRLQFQPDATLRLVRHQSCHALRDSRWTQPASPGISSHKTEEGDGRAPQQLWFPAGLQRLGMLQCLQLLARNSQARQSCWVLASDLLSPARTQHGNTAAMGPLSPTSVAGRVLPCSSQPNRHSGNGTFPPALGYLSRGISPQQCMHQCSAPQCSWVLPACHVPRAKDFMPTLSHIWGSEHWPRESHSNTCQATPQPVCSPLSKSETFVFLSARTWVA